MTLALAKQDIVLGRLGALNTVGDIGDRTRGLGKGGLLTIAAKDRTGAGADLDGAMATFDHELPTDELEVVLALRNIFLTVGRAGAGLMNPCSRTAAVFWVGVLGRVEGTIHLCRSGDSTPKPRPSRSDAAPSRSCMPSADRAREAAVGALYEALEVEATVTAEYEEARVGRTGREPVKCLSNPSLLIPRASESENTPATESTRLWSDPFRTTCCFVVGGRGPFTFPPCDHCLLGALVEGVIGFLSNEGGGDDIVSRVSNAPAARVGVGEVAPLLPGTRPRGGGEGTPESEGDNARLRVAVRDGDRSLAGEMLGEWAPEADRAGGGRLLARGGVVRLFSFEGERSAESSRTSPSRKSSFSM